MSFLSGAKAQGKAATNAKPAASAAAGKPGARRDQNKPQRGRYATMGNAKPRSERLRDGRYRVKINTTGAFDGRNHDFFRIKCEVLKAGPDAACKEGVEYLVDYMVDKGDMRDMNGPKVVSFVMTAIGIATEEEFRESFPLDSQAFEDLMDLADGAEVPGTETGLGPNPCGGAVLLVQAYGNGRMAEDGSEYQNYNWFPNEEEA